MAISDYGAAFNLQSQAPHTFNSLQYLIMAMEDYYKNKDKTTWFGNDKGLKYYKAFESKLTDTLIALHLDGIVDDRYESAQKYYMALIVLIGNFGEAFPNWHGAYTFANEHFILKRDDATRHIAHLIGVPFQPGSEEDNTRYDLG